ncbi:MAG TPA: glycosyltransferase family 2 protein [Cyclobacteriaceae bacterium]|nr:glycosyltransferase family 2 protein [Cyclobacteriaceae bacterium]
MQNTDISIIIPVFEEEESLRELYDWILKVMQQRDFSFEVIFIDDGSRDGSWKAIASIAASDPRIKGIRFNRNYGKSAALHTGFHEASGDVVVTLDSDLQDSPEEIPALYDMIRNQGFDLVSGWKKKRYDPPGKTLPSKLFNRVTRAISGIKLHDFNCGLKAYRKEVVKNIDVYGEMHRYIPVIAKWNGFDRIGEKIVQHHKRKYGKSKFGLERLINGFLDLISIAFVIRFIKKPMHFFGTIGTLSFLTGLIITFWLIGLKIYHIRNHLPARDIVDQPLFFLALVAVIVGVQMFLTGFLAEILTLNSEKTNRYLVIEKLGFDR